MKKLIKNYTTDIPLEKTIAEIQQILGGNGATGIAFEYKEGQIEAVFFKIKYQQRDLAFRLPAKPQEVYNALFANKRGEGRYKEERMKKARMIAWRICKTWLEAQITHINLGQAKVQEVFLPYLVIGENKTLYQSMEEKQFLLESGS